MRIYFARHGESLANTLHEMSSRGLKYPLTPTGRRQARSLAERLLGASISHIYTSPALACLETSIIAAHQLNVTYEVSEALREFSVGALEGRSDAHSWELWRELFEAWTRYKRWDRRLEGGETFFEVRKRFEPFVESLFKQYGGTSVRLLCMGHGGLFWTALPLVLKNIDYAFIARHNGLQNGALVVAEFCEDGLHCIEWNGKPVEQDETTFAQTVRGDG